ncbi:unnamed protein product [Effrenium voratum]|nr:unnamed protein product [Effrenium voratum]
MGGTGRDATHGAEAPEPELDVMYLRYKQQPIDTTPVFNRMDVEYNATMDFKMEFFAVQATALGEAIITNIYLCPKADCHQETPRAMVDFSRRVSLDPGEKTLYKFDVELQGKARTYSITIQRLTGRETGLRHLIVQGNTLYPKFRPDILRYRCFLEVGTEFGLLELHLLDQGQTVLAEAEAPVKLAEARPVGALAPLGLWGFGAGGDWMDLAEDVRQRVQLVIEAKEDELIGGADCQGLAWGKITHQQRLELIRLVATQSVDEALMERQRMERQAAQAAEEKVVQMRHCHEVRMASFTPVMWRRLLCSYLLPQEEVLTLGSCSRFLRQDHALGLQTLILPGWLPMEEEKVSLTHVKPMPPQALKARYGT